MKNYMLKEFDPGPLTPESDVPVFRKHRGKKWLMFLGSFGVIYGM